MSERHAWDSVLLECLDAVAVVTLNRPERRNALGGTLREDLVADDAPARAEFGWDPRPFQPDASTWGLAAR